MRIHLAVGAGALACLGFACSSATLQRHAPLAGATAHAGPTLTFTDSVDMHVVPSGEHEARPPRCTLQPVLSSGNGQLHVRGLFSVPEAGPGLQAQLVSQGDLLTLEITTTGYGAVAMVSDHCYDARIAPLAPGSYSLLIVHLVHSPFERVKVARVLEALAVVK